VVLGRDGKLFAAVASGRILRMNPDCSAPRSKPRLASACSALTSTPRRRRIAADAVRGLLAVDSDRRASVLSNQVNGDPVRYADAAAVARNGKIYVSDASGRLAPAAWGGTFEAAVLDIIERRATGRIVDYDPAT
jgi:sugar lactone lactonase YvrE